MKFSALVIALAAGSASAFAPVARGPAHQRSLSSTTESVETEAVAPVEVPVAEAPVTDVVDGAVVMEAPVEAEMKVEMPIADTVDKSRIQPGRYADKENSIALPFMMRPPALDGTHAGDFGFDPLGFTEDFDLYTLQEAEIRHARLAMLAVVGWPLSELLAPNFMLQDGRAPSVLNGFNPVSFLSVAAIFGALGYFEFKTSLRRVDDKEFGKIHREDMADVWKWGVAGDYNWDPLNLYSSIGDDAYARKGLRELEISHGRSAMLGITSFAIWEKLTGHAIVENSMFFHPNAMLPLLVGAYVAFNQVYELEDSETFMRFKMSSEGEARMENMRLSMPSTEGADIEKMAEDVTSFVEKVGESYEKAQNFYVDNVVNGDKKN